MKILTASKLEALSIGERRRFEELLPEIVRRLISDGAHSENVKSIYMPSGDNIVLSGYDGIVESSEGSFYVDEGVSVWEFGNGKNYLRKINEDYEKRTNDSLGIDKSAATFYFVITKKWTSKTPKKVWENEHGDWKNVKVYDAIDLCDWINSEPVVLSWFFKEFFGETVGFSPIEDAWKSFSRKTNPPFSHSIFLDSRDTERHQLLNKVKESTEGIICVKGETFIEAQGFTISSLLQAEDLKEKIIVVENRETYNVLSNEVKGKIFLLGFDFFGDVNPGNTVIALYNKEASSVNADVVLSQLTRSHFEKAFKDMGMSSSDASRLYSKTHGNMRAIIRSIPGTYVEKKPEWANASDIEMLVPLLFLRSFNRTRNEDKELVAKLANSDYRDIEKVYKRLSRLEDSPLKVVDDYFIIVNYDEAWNVLSPTTEDISFDILHDTVMHFLNKVSDSQMLENYNLIERDTTGLLGRLIQNYTSFYYDNGRTQKLEKAVSDIVSMLDSVNVQEYIGEHLWIFAIISPETLMRYITNDLKNEESTIRDSFVNAGYSSKYVNTLALLDELALQEKTTRKAVDVLIQLYLLGGEYKATNSPKESLLNVLCLWSDYGPISLSAKVRTVEKLIEMHPIMGCNFAIELLGKNRMYISTRSDKQGKDIKGVYIPELLRAYQSIGRLVMDRVIDLHIPEQISKIGALYYRMTPDDFVASASLFQAADYSSEALALLNYHFRNIKFGSEKSGNINDEYRKGFNAWIEKTDSLDACGKVLWMFKDYYLCPADELIKYSDDYISLNKKTKELRIKVVRQLLSESDGKSIHNLIASMSDLAEWGHLFAEIKQKRHVFTIANSMIDNNKKRMIGGFLSNIKLAYAKQLFEAFPSEEKKEIVRFIYRNDIELWSLTSEEEENYWATKIMYKYDENTFNALMQFNPGGLLYYCSDEIKKGSSDAIKDTIRVLKQLESKTNTSDINISIYTIQDIVERIDLVHYSAEWCELCRNLLEIGLLEKYTIGVKRWFLNNPQLFYEHIQDDKDRYFKVLLYYRLPPDAYNDYDKLKDFTKRMIELSGMYLMGHVIGRSIDGKDGWFPHENVRRLLEEIDDEDFDREVLCGRTNSGEGRTVSDGIEERDLSEKYKMKALELSYEYPHTAWILSRISEDYEYGSRSDYIYSELRQ